MKCVIVLDRALPPGAAANAAAVLALTLGRRVDGLVGHDLPDGDGRLHAGITTRPVAILTAEAADLAAMRKRLYGEADPDMLAVDFTDAARSTRTYDDYAEALRSRAGDDLAYVGLALAGPPKRVARLTGHLALYR